MPVYATPEDVEWTGAAAPDNADRLLAAASRLVRRATITAIYATDTAGLPTDARVLEAFRDATAAQAATWDSLGIDPAKGPAGAAAAPVPVSSSIGGASVNFGTASVGELRAICAETLTSEAAGILAGTGLIRQPMVYG